MDSALEAKYRISWYDAEKTILVCEVTERWSWDETYAVVGEMNRWCSTVQHGVYTIFHFQNKGVLLPGGKTAIADIRKLIDTEHPNDELILFIGASALVNSLVNIAGQVYGMRNILNRFRFVYSMEEALIKIERHKTEKLGQVRG
jgi:hypothetical protein